MSHVLAIGIEPAKISDELATALSDAGFTPAAPVASSDPLMNETIHHAQAQAPGHVWFVAVRDGRVDLDRIYSFAALAEDGPFAALLEYIAHDVGLGRVAVWVYDLGDGCVDRQAEEPLSRLVETLTRAYQAGGPMRSAYAHIASAIRKADTMTLSNVQLPAPTESFEAATARHRARIEAVPAEDIQYVYADPLTVVRTVLNAEKRYLAFRPRMASLSGEVDLEQVEHCASYGRAYWYYSSRVINVPSEPGFDKAAAHAEGLKLRDLLATVRSGLGKAHITSGAAHMRPLAGNAGHDNVASDLVMHLAFFTDHWTELEGKVPITRADLGRAEALANALVADDQKPSPLAEGSPQLLAYQAGTLFLRAYAEVRRAIVFLRGRQGDADEIAPPVYSGRTPPKRADKPTPEQPSVQSPAAPAEPAPALPLAKPETPVGLKGSRPFVV